MSGDDSRPDDPTEADAGGHHVFGDAVTLVAAHDSVTARLVAALGDLPAQGLHSFCVIGGLAVLCRAGALYRATSDLDAVVESGGAVLAALRAQPGAERTANGVSLAGTVLDLIEVGPIDDADLPDDEGDRLFVLGHRYAYDTAAAVTITIVDPLDAEAGVQVVAPLASPPALVAMKLHSYPGRRGRATFKQGSDLQDLVALLDRHDRGGAVGATLAAAGHGLGALCADATQRLLVDDAEVASNRVRRYTGTEIGAEVFDDLGRRLVAGITGAPLDF